MGRHRFGMSWPNSSPDPYGNRTRCVVPVGTKEIAINSNSWAAAPQLVAFLASPSAHYVECNFVYAKNVTDIYGNQLAEGWYFWRGYLNTTQGKLWEAYVALTFNPVGDDVTITLHNSNGTWYASYQDHTRGILNSYQIQQAPDSKLYPGTSNFGRHRIGMENGSSNCAHYSSFNELKFTKYKYLDWSGSETSQNPQADTIPDNNPQTCIGMDKPTMKIYRI